MKNLWIGVAVTLLLAFGVLYLVYQDPSGAAETSGVAVGEAMRGDTTGYARADRPRTFSFPADHGPHPDFKTEWWYFTGNLNTAQGRRFGYQFTVFRIALAPPAARDTTRSLGWAADQFYMAHLTLADVEEKKFYAFERFSRGAAGLAGAEGGPMRVWLEGWEAAGDPDKGLELTAQDEGIALDLRLDPAKALVLQGDRGYDKKGPDPGDASYYYSITRLATTGNVQVGENTFDVAGLSWMDREWSTSALGADQEGWDWFSLQLGNGYDLMYYQLRDRGGRPGPFSGGVLVEPNGTARQMDREDVQLEVEATWNSPRGDAQYPARWTLSIPGEQVNLRITPVLADQELHGAVRYWEGAVDVEGTMNGRDITGSGYVELTGYDQVAPGGRLGSVEGGRAEP